MTEHTFNDLEISDEVLDGPAQSAVPSGLPPCAPCRPCYVGDEALDAPEQQAYSCYCAPCYVSDEALDTPIQQATNCLTCNGFCGYCSVSDSIVA